MIRHYGGKPIDIDSLAVQCCYKYGSENVQVIASKETILTSDINAMLHIAGFFLYDADITAEKNDLTNYISKNCLKSSGKVEMTTQQKFILIFKKD